ncbi:MAG: carbohydrate ABC transporter permease [Hungatella sp.]|nr:carbohydrate ABC transporter permease [Hungatella sp.]
MTRKRIRTIGVYTALIIGLFIIAIPFYLSLVSSVKTQSELSRNFFGLPVKATLENYFTIMQKGDFLPALSNSFVITVVSLAGFAILLPMASYPISRRMGTSRIYMMLYYYMLASIFIPFQVKMIPIVKLMNTLNIANRWGLILLYLAGSTGEGMFLMTGYLSTIPTDMEEAAYIDGASTWQVFTQIIAPVMRPITATVLIKNCLWVWNDFMMPSMVLRLREDRTLPLFQYAFQGEYATNYPLVFAAFVMAMIPIMIFYCIMQKNIIEGMMSGAVKG